MADPAVDPKPSYWALIQIQGMGTVGSYLVDTAKSFALGFMAAAMMFANVAPSPMPTPVPIPAPSPTPTPVPLPIPVPVPPAPPPPPPVKHTRTLFLSFIEPVDATVKSSTIRDAAVGTDWKGLNCIWRAYVATDPDLVTRKMDQFASSKPVLIVQELNPGVTFDASAQSPPAPVIDVSSPDSFDDVMTKIKSLRGL